MVFFISIFWMRPISSSSKGFSSNIMGGGFMDLKPYVWNSFFFSSSCFDQNSFHLILVRNCSILVVSIFWYWIFDTKGMFLSE